MANHPSNRVFDFGNLIRPSSTPGRVPGDRAQITPQDELFGQGRPGNPQRNSPFFDFNDLLEDVPEAAFFAANQGFSRRSPARRQFAQGQFSVLQNDFLGELGRQIQSGGVPNLRFQDFLNRPENSLNRRFFQTGRSQRPGGNVLSRLAPSTRFFL